MKKLLAIGGSSSRESINVRFAGFGAALVEDSVVTATDLNDFEMPIFSVDREQESGIPEKAVAFKKLIDECDGVVLSLAEHNGSYSAAFKNILDWSSRIDSKLWNDKPIFLLSTSPGARGGATILGVATTYLPFMGGNVVAGFSLPSFYDNFSDENGIKAGELRDAFETELAKFVAAL